MLPPFALAITNFQFPQSERVNCNNAPYCFTIRSKSKLSVSTIGTSELQLPEQLDRSLLLKWLSVSTIGTSELQLLERALAGERDALSVSTIGTSELQLITQRAWGVVYMDFQFPQSERVNCNEEESSRLFYGNYLSVSTIGTSELQRAHSRIAANRQGAFSFHNRNE